MVALSFGRSKVRGTDLVGSVDLELGGGRPPSPSKSKSAYDKTG